MAVLAPWDIRSQNPFFSKNGYPKEPAQGSYLRKEVTVLHRPQALPLAFPLPPSFSFMTPCHLGRSCS